MNGKVAYLSECNFLIFQPGFLHGHEYIQELLLHVLARLLEVHDGNVRRQGVWDQVRVCGRVQVHPELRLTLHLMITNLQYVRERIQVRVCGRVQVHPELRLTLHLMITNLQYVREYR